MQSVQAQSRCSKYTMLSLVWPAIGTFPFREILKSTMQSLRKSSGDQKTLKRALHVSRAEFVKAMQEECPSIYISLAQRHLDWLQECEPARACLRVASEVLEANPMDDKALYAFPEVRMAWGYFTDTHTAAAL